MSTGDCLRPLLQADHFGLSAQNSGPDLVGFGLWVFGGDLAVTQCRFGLRIKSRICTVCRSMEFEDHWPKRLIVRCIDRRILMQ